MLPGKQVLWHEARQGCLAGTGCESWWVPRRTAPWKRGPMWPGCVILYVEWHFRLVMHSCLTLHLNFRGVESGCA